MADTAVAPVGATAAAEPSPRDIRAVAEGFEALFVLELLKAARVSGQSGEWQDLVERHMADAVARGAPFGLAAALFPEGMAE
jgi:Rod binding domain-containing protein